MKTRVLNRKGPQQMSTGAAARAAPMRGVACGAGVARGRCYTQFASTRSGTGAATVSGRMSWAASAASHHRKQSRAVARSAHGSTAGAEGADVELGTTLVAGRALSELCSWQIGGPARYAAEAHDLPTLRALVRYASRVTSHVVAEEEERRLQASIRSSTDGLVTPPRDAHQRAQSNKARWAASG